MISAFGQGSISLSSIFIVRFDNKIQILKAWGESEICGGVYVL